MRLQAYYGLYHLGIMILLVLKRRTSSQNYVENQCPNSAQPHCTG